MLSHYPLSVLQAVVVFISCYGDVREARDVEQYRR